MRRSYVRILLTSGPRSYMAGMLKFLVFLEQSYPSIAGTISNFNGAVIHNPLRPLIENIDILPFPDFTDIPKKKYGAVSIQSSRGCVARCAFCETIYWSRYRWRKPEKVVEEMEFQHKRYMAKSFRFHDSLINSSPKNLEKICDLFDRKGHGYHLGRKCQGRPYFAHYFIIIEFFLPFDIILFFLIISKIDTYFHKKLQAEAQFDRITGFTG
jgi:hypothetical protein